MDHDFDPLVDQAPPPRPMIDAARPWLEAGRSHLAVADRIAALDGRRRWWQSPPDDELRYRKRASAAATLGRQLDRLTARGYYVWHDRIAPFSRIVIDHVLVGPTGVVALQAVPVLDRMKGDPQQPGIRTQQELSAVSTVLHEQIGPMIHGACTVIAQEPPDLPQIFVRWHIALVDPSLKRTFPDVLRPHEVDLYVDHQGALFDPLMVRHIAAQLEPVMPPAPLNG